MCVSRWACVCVAGWLCVVRVLSERLNECVSASVWHNRVYKAQFGVHVLVTTYDLFTPRINSVYNFSNQFRCACGIERKKSHEMNMSILFKKKSRMLSATFGILMDNLMLCFAFCNFPLSSEFFAISIESGFLFETNELSQVAYTDERWRPRIQTYTRTHFISKYSYEMHFCVFSFRECCAVCLCVQSIGIARRLNEKLLKHKRKSNRDSGRDRDRNRQYGARARKYTLTQRDELVHCQNVLVGEYGVMTQFLIVCLISRNLRPTRKSVGRLQTQMFASVFEICERNEWILFLALKQRVGKNYFALPASLFKWGISIWIYGTRAINV